RNCRLRRCVAEHPVWPSPAAGWMPFHVTAGAEMTTTAAYFPGYKKALVADLVPYARNARTHSDAQVAEIAASIREFGFTNPVLGDGDNGIIAGHGRVLAARKLRMGELPVIEFAGMSETQKRAYILADNKIAMNAGWDREMLSLELGELAGLEFELALTGFGEEEVADL